MPREITLSNISDVHLDLAFSVEQRDERTGQEQHLPALLSLHMRVGSAEGETIEVAAQQTFGSPQASPMDPASICETLGSAELSQAMLHEVSPVARVLLAWLIWPIFAPRILRHVCPATVGIACVLRFIG